MPKKKKKAGKLTNCSFIVLYLNYKHGVHLILVVEYFVMFSWFLAVSISNYSFHSSLAQSWFSLSNVVKVCEYGSLVWSVFVCTPLCVCTSNIWPKVFIL